MAPLMTVDELAALLNVTKGTLYNWVHLRRIPFVKAGRCLRFDPKQVLESLQHCPTIEEAAKR